MLLYGPQANANIYQSCHISNWYGIPNPRHPDRFMGEMVQLDESYEGIVMSWSNPADKQRDIYLHYR